MPSSSLAEVSTCKKYPGHEDFISLKEFSPKHLRAMQQNPKLFDLIKAQGALTLKIKNRKVKKLKKGEKPIGSQSTGFVIWVEKRSSGIGQSCQCSDCISNIVNSEHNEWYDFIIITSASAIPSQKAADAMKLEFNFDDGQGGKTQILKGNCKYVKVNENICQLHCFTFDLDLGCELKSHFARFEGVVSNAYNHIKEDSEYMFSFTVSHPHGCEKHVSYSLEKDLFKAFGGSKLRFLEKNKGRVIWPSIWNYVKVLYLVPTCPGSSGAIVMTLTRKNGIIISLHLSGSQRMSWTKETNVKHFSELLQPDVDPDRDEDLGPRVKFGSGKGTAERHERQLAEAEKSAPEDDKSKPVHHPTVRKISGPQPKVTIRRLVDKPQGDEERNQPPVSRKQELAPDGYKLKISKCPIINERPLLDQIPAPTGIEENDSDSKYQIDEKAASIEQASETMEDEDRDSNVQIDKEKVPIQSILESFDRGPIFEEDIYVSVECEESVGDSQSQVEKKPVAIDQINIHKGDEDRFYQAQSHVEKKLESLDHNRVPIESEDKFSQDPVEKKPTSVKQLSFPIDCEDEPCQSHCVEKPGSEDHEDLLVPTENQDRASQSQIEETSTSIDRLHVAMKCGTENQSQVEMKPLFEDHIILPKDVDDNLSQRQAEKELMSEDQMRVPMNNEGKVSHTQAIEKVAPVFLDRIHSPLQDGDTVVPIQVEKEPVTTDKTYMSTEGEYRLSHCELDTESKSGDEIQTPIPMEYEQGSQQESTPQQKLTNLPPSLDASVVVGESELIKSKGARRKIKLTSNQNEKSLNRQTRQGLPESEVCYGPEADFMLKYNACAKNPGHDMFFHFKELRTDHLPEGFRDDTLLDYLHDLGALTVKVSTSYVSRKRPEFHPHTGNPYLFHSGKGLKFLRAGTGFAVSTRHVSLRYGQACQCVECVSSNSVRYDCHQVIIMTATHNVFDQAEANKTEIQFSYFQDVPEIKTKVLNGKCLHSVINEDVCWLEYYTHDQSLIQALQKHIDQFQERSLKLSNGRKNDSFVAMVSYPHGTRKQHLSFGKVLSDSEVLALEDTSDGEDSSKAKKKDKAMENRTSAFQFYTPFDKVVLWPGDLFRPIVCQQFPRICYTTPTCPGSSGALILVHQPGIGNVIYTHWGSGNESDTYNRSGGGTVFFLNDSQILPH